MCFVVTGKTNPTDMELSLDVDSWLNVGCGVNCQDV